MLLKMFSVPEYPAFFLCPLSPLSSLFAVLTHLLSYWGLGYTDGLVYSHKNMCGELSAVPHS